MGGGMKKIFIILTMFIFSLCAQANVSVIKNNKIKNDDVSEASVYFNTIVNDNSITSLLFILSEINVLYPNIKNVDIYINSLGGDMDAGYVAYEALRKSPIKLRMINASIVASSATMIYCASEERYSMPLASFMLHSAAVSNDKTDFLNPAQAQYILDAAENYNNFFKVIYASCTNLSAEDIKKITSSEMKRTLYTIDDAKKKGLVTRDIKENHKSHHGELTYYITNDLN